MTTTAHEDQWSEERADVIGQNGNDGEHYGAREFNPATSSMTDSQARGAALDTGMCSDGKRCGVPPAVGDDAYCAECPNRDESPANQARRVIEDGHARGVFTQLPPDTEGLKFDTEKPRFDLLLGDMPLALEAVARVLTVGAQKYADGNWQRVENAERRYLAAGTRHELALAKGERHDPETGEHHLAHKLCCDLFRLELALRESEQ